MRVRVVLPINFVTRYIVEFFVNTALKIPAFTRLFRVHFPFKNVTALRYNFVTSLQNARKRGFLPHFASPYYTKL